MSERTLTSISGNSQRLDGGAMFGNAPRPVWKRWIEPDERNRIPLACRALLVRDGEKTILFEAGIGVFFEPAMKDRFGVIEEEHLLLSALARVGVRPEDVDIVVLSHLHFDHAGGMLTPWREDAPPALVFPRARVLVGERAWERATHPHPRDRASFIPPLNALLEGSGRLERVTAERSPTLGDGYRFRISDGHTPGMLVTEIDMPDGPVAFAADLIPGQPWVHLPITMGYDRYPEKLIDEKQELLSYLDERGGRLYYTHDPVAAMSHIERDERGRYHAAESREVIANLTR